MFIPSSIYIDLNVLSTPIVYNIKLFIWNAKLKMIRWNSKRPSIETVIPCQSNNCRKLQYT